MQRYRWLVRGNQRNSSRHASQKIRHITGWGKRVESVKAGGDAVQVLKTAHQNAGAVSALAPRQMPQRFGVRLVLRPLTWSFIDASELAPLPGGAI